MAENRAHPRYEIDADVDLAALGEAAPPSAQVQNLSLGGICIQAAEITEVGAPVDVKLRFRDGDQVALRGQVVWVNRTPPQDVGIRWLELDAAGRDILSRHLSEALERTRPGAG